MSDKTSVMLGVLPSVRLGLAYAGSNREDVLSLILPVLGDSKSNMEVSCPCPSQLDVPLMEFMYLVFTHMPHESCHRQLGSLLLCLCDIF